MGGGYIGLEMAAGLSMNGLDVHALIHVVSAFSHMSASGVHEPFRSPKKH